MRFPCQAILSGVPVLQTGTLLKILRLGLRPRLLMARAFGAPELRPGITMAGPRSVHWFGSWILKERRVERPDRFAPGILGGAASSALRVATS